MALPAHLTSLPSTHIVPPVVHQIPQHAPTPSHLRAFHLLYPLPGMVFPSQLPAHSLASCRTHSNVTLSDAPSLTTGNTHFPKSATEIPFHSCFTNVSESNFKWLDEFKVLLMTCAFVVKRSSVNAVKSVSLFICHFGSFPKCLSFGHAFHH